MFCTCWFDSNAVGFAHAAVIEYTSRIATCKGQRQGGQTMQQLLADVAKATQ